MFSFISIESARRGRLQTFAAGALTVAALSIASVPAQAGVGAVEYTYLVPFAAGQTFAVKTVTPVTPAGKVLVIDHISMYRFPASASSLQTFLGTNGGYVVLPDIRGNGDIYPAAATNLTVYVLAGKTAYLNLYRTGSALIADTAYVTLMGHLAAQ